MGQSVRYDRGPDVTAVAFKAYAFAPAGNPHALPATGQDTCHLVTGSETFAGESASSKKEATRVTYSSRSLK